MTIKSLAIVAALPVVLAMSFAAQAHDFTVEIAQYNKTAATKKLDSAEAIQAKIALERSYGVLEQADVRMLTRIRSMTNDAFKELGEQPAFLTSEIKRLEAALASPKTTDTAKIAKARAMLAIIKNEKAAYDALDNEAGDSMKMALKLIETAPAK